MVDIAEITKSVALPLSEWKQDRPAIIKSVNQQFELKLQNEIEVLEFIERMASTYEEKFAQFFNRTGSGQYFTQAGVFFRRAIAEAHNDYFDGIRKIGRFIENDHLLIPDSAMGLFIANGDMPYIDRGYALFFLSEIDFRFFDEDNQRIVTAHAGLVEAYQKEWRSNNDINSIEPALILKKVFANQFASASEIKANLRRASSSLLDTQKKMRAAVEENATQAADLEKHATELIEKLTNQSKELIEATEAKSKDLANELDNRAQAIDEVIKTAITNQRLEPAAVFWDAEAKRSERLAKRGLWGFGFTAIGSIVLLSGILYLSYTPPNNSFLENMDSTTAIVTNQNTSIDWTSLLSKLPFISLAFFLLIWLLKHFSRVFVDGFNLANDARFRYVLTKVYGEFKADANLRDEHRDIMVKAMFGPRTPNHKDADIQPSPVGQIVNITDTKPDKPK